MNANLLIMTYLMAHQLKPVILTLSIITLFQLLSLVENYIPKFTKMNKNAKYELLMTGIKNHDPDYNDLNAKLTIAVQNFIIQTKHFLQNNE